MDSGVCVVAPKAGKVEYVSSNLIKMTYDDGEKAEFRLSKFSRSNQSNCYNQKPIVFKGDHVGTHQRTVGIIVFQERDQGRSHREHHPGGHVHVVKHGLGTLFLRGTMWKRDR